jgi:hypothetical protein
VQQCNFFHAANISVVLLVMPVDGAKDDIPVFCSASCSLSSMQVWHTYHCHKKPMLLFLISKEDFCCLLVIRHCWLASVARLEGYACFKFHHAATGTASRWVSDEDFVKNLFSVAWRQQCHHG